MVELNVIKLISLCLGKLNNRKNGMAPTKVCLLLRLAIKQLIKLMKAKRRSRGRGNNKMYKN